MSSQPPDFIGCSALKSPLSFPSSSWPASNRTEPAVAEAWGLCRSDLGSLCLAQFGPGCFRDDCREDYTCHSHVLKGGMQPCPYWERDKSPSGRAENMCL